MSVKDVCSEGYKKQRLSDLSVENAGQKVIVFGWVTKSTPLKNHTFVELTSGFSTVKVVLSGYHKLTFSTTLTVRGEVKKVEKQKDAFPFEIEADDFMVYRNTVAESFPVNKDSDKKALLEHRHLALRMPERVLFLKARSELLRVLRDFYHSAGFVEVAPPTIVQTQVEGGSTLFSVDYYGAPAYLTQSSQLYLETVAPVTGACFCIMPSYRAEVSKTSRHLSEYTHVEGEIVDITFPELMDSIEALVRHVIAGFYKDMLPDIQRVNPKFVPVSLRPEPFLRITYKEAIEFLIKRDHRKQNNEPYAMMDDICDASERFLVSEHGNQPIFLTNFPVEHKPFYMRRSDGFTESCDLLFPGIGEIAGGSMRCDSYDDLLAGFKRENLDVKSYKWYLDLALYGPSPHGGYGIGFERLMMGIMGYKNVDEATLYPRKFSRCTP